MEPKPVTIRQTGQSQPIPVVAQVRATFYAPDGNARTAAIWVDVVEGGYRLQHDYPDFKPMPGDGVEAGALRHRITAVNGRTLVCAEVKGDE